MSLSDFWRGWLAGALAGGVAFAFAPSLPAQSNLVLVPSVQTVTLLEAKGRVDVVQEGRKWPARPQQSLAPGNRVQTWINSQALLLWYDRVTFQISELSDVAIPPPPGADQPTLVETLRGFLYIFHRDKPGKFELRTPTARAVVRGTELSLRVEENGRTVLTLFDGEVELSNPLGQIRLGSGEMGIVDPGTAPRPTPIVAANNDLIQWFLYYPAVLGLEEAGLDAAEQQALAVSLAAYAEGDLPAALEQYPTGRQPGSDAEKIYMAALLLTVGQVDKAEAFLGSLTPNAQRPMQLAAALRKLIAAVKGQDDPTVLAPQLATGWLAESYYQQSRADLPQALAAATKAAQRSPRFGFAWTRLAELQFSFRRIRDARAALERALALAPRDAQAMALNGFLLSAQNRTAKALAYFDRAIAQDGGLGNAWLGRGLCRIRRNDRAAGLLDLQIAAAVEPQRALLRSYLGKAFHDAGEAFRAVHELDLAKGLDPNDPTAWLYSALLEQQSNRLNTAVSDLERSQALNEHRAIYRSRLLLDEDRAMRSVNLARLYAEAGMSEVSLREATRAVNVDYANYSAHLFLAHSYNQLRDPGQVDLRYETPAYSEYLIANLLAPVGAGPLSPAISQQEYSKLFERDGLRLVSQTEYGSRGDWVQSGAQYGLFGNLSYALEGLYRSENGQRLNDDLEQSYLTLQTKLQIAPPDTLFFQAAYYSIGGGDLKQYYDPARANPDLRFEERQNPLLLAGYHHEWTPGSHTLLFASRIQDCFEFSDPSRGVGVLVKLPETIVPQQFILTAPFESCEDTIIHSIEGQHIWQTERQTLIAGARYQNGAFDTQTALGRSTRTQWLNTNGFPNPFNIPPSTAQSQTDLDRLGLYAYDQLQVAEPLLLSAGLSYELIDYPINHQTPPISDGHDTADQLSPKVGLTWWLTPRTTLRGAYTRSLGGATFEQSLRLEPSQVAGFNQAFRSLVPESVVGPSIAPANETVGLAAEHHFTTGTYLGVSAELLRTDFTREFGVFDLVYTSDDQELFIPSTTREKIDFEERTLLVTANQLLGRDLSLGLRYRISQAELTTRLPDIPPAAATAVRLPTRTDLEATLQQLSLYAILNHPSGFYVQADSLWSAQDNQGDSSDLADEDFWQFNLYAGYRFPRRRADVRLGLLNITDQDYRLNPLNLTAELSRDRTFTASLRFNF